MKKFCVKIILKVLSIIDIINSESFELTSKRKDGTVYTINFSDEEIEKIL